MYTTNTQHTDIKNSAEIQVEDERWEWKEKRFPSQIFDQ